MDERNAIHRIKEPRRSIGGSTPPPVTKKLGKRARRCSTMQDKQDSIEGPDE